MKRLDFITKTIHKYILDEPDENIVLIEVLPNNVKYKIIEDEDYIYKQYGKFIRFDSLKRTDGEHIFSCNFEFLNTINSNFSKQKVVISKKNLSPRNVHFRLKKLIRNLSIDDIEHTMNMYFCNTEMNEIEKTIEFDICSYSSSKIVLSDEYGNLEYIILEEVTE